MSVFLVNLLVVVLLLILIKMILEAVSLGEPATKIFWIISLVVGVLWLLFGFISLPLR